MADFVSSFELNQSYRTNAEARKFLSTLKKCIKFTGDELDSCCYNGTSNESRLSVGKSVVEEQDSTKSQNDSRPVSSLSFNASWSSFPEMSTTFDDYSSFMARTSNKAVLAFDAKTKEILTANKQACILFEHTSDSIVQMNLQTLFNTTSENMQHKKALMFDFDDTQGNVTVMSGKVREIITRQGRVVPVSLWAKKYEGKDRRKIWVLVMESVTRITGNFTFNVQGDILHCDDDFARIHGYPTASTLENTDLKKLMPGYEVPQLGCRLTRALRKQYTTSTMNDGTRFPISVYLRSQEMDDVEGQIFAATVWFFSNISGPFTASSSGIIRNINSNFSLSLLGYTASELKNKNITTLLPDLRDGHVRKLTDTKDVSAESIVPIPDSSDERIVAPSQAQSSDCTSSFVNISIPLSPSSKSPPNSTLDKINSLLLGKSPLCTDYRSKNEISTPEKMDSFGCAFGQRTVDDSWIEVSLNPGSNPGKSPEQESESIRKINLLLNGSADLLAENERSSESAIESLSHAHPHSNGTSGMAPNQSVDSSPISRARLLGSFDSNKENAADLNSASDTDSLFSNTKKFSINRSKLLLENVTSTPLDQEKKKEKSSLKEGSFQGQAMHKDGSLIAVSYEIRYNPQCDIYCVWLSLGLENLPFNSSFNSNQTLHSSFNSTLPSLNTSFVGSVCDQSLGTAIRQAAQKLNESSDSLYLPQEGTDEWLAVQGKFGDNYEMRRALGNGAFGFVRNARHRKTNKKFVVKFIRKEKVLEECWVDDYEFDSMIPLEIALLAKFDHPNIIKVVDFFENDDFFAMVMPTHGAHGIDLFEFIEREPRLNENIASYIFRQIASAVYFLHQEGVVHRDIKDENVIIDENFTCKLIDFGSAAFFKPGQTFAAFCGTVEYCSPEILMGARYEGPELEVWALGVTLYTLVFGENPFSSIDEIVGADLQPPHFLSQELMSLIHHMLDPAPKARYTMRDVMCDRWVNFPVDISVYNWEEVLPPAKNNRSKRSFMNVSELSKYYSQQPDESSEGESILSSRETLANHLRKWRECGDTAEKDDSQSPQKDNLLPLTRNLANFNLNHSI